MILLDTRYRLIRVHPIQEVSLGSVNESIAHPRDIFRPAVISSAYAVIVVHNHPSGDASPSQTDHSLTRRLAEAAELMQIKLLDHIIIGAPAEGQAGLTSVSRRQGCCKNGMIRNPKFETMSNAKIHPTALVDPARESATMSRSDHFR